MTTPTLMTLDEQFSETAGAIVWWALSGYTDIDEIADALVAYSLPAEWAPPAPRIETVAKRAVSACARSNRELVRPLKTRGSFDLVAEQVQEIEGEEQLSYSAQVRVKVVETTLENGETHKQVVCVPSTAADVEMAERVAAEVPRLQRLLTPNDISVWLLNVLDNMNAVSLRPRGGFYFIPAGAELEQWRRVAKAVQGSSGHTMFSIPAVRSEDAVEAILSAVKREADQQFSALETYLCEGEPSTRGINAHTRATEAMLVKLKRYAGLLGVNLEQFTDRAENLLGLLVAAKVTKT